MDLSSVEALVAEANEIPPLYVLDEALDVDVQHEDVAPVDLVEDVVAADEQDEDEVPVNMLSAAPAPFQGRGQFFVFTLWDVHVDDLGVPLLFSALMDPECKKRPAGFIAQCELSPQTGNFHVQGYFETDAQVGFNTVHRYEFWFGRLWVRRARGSAASNIAYCSKLASRFKNATWPDGIFLRFGRFAGRGQGKRSDLLMIKHAIDQGWTLAEVARDDVMFPTWAKYTRAIKEYLLYSHEPVTAARTVTVYWGDAGSGKSYAAREYFKSRGIKWYELSLNKKSGTYFVGYCNQPGLLIDEFRGDRLPLDFMKMLCGDGPVRLPDYMSELPSSITHVVITSQRHPYGWYTRTFDNNPQEWRALERRLTEVKQFVGQHPSVLALDRSWPCPLDDLVRYRGAHDDHEPDNVRRVRPRTAEDDRAALAEGERGEIREPYLVDPQTLFFGGRFYTLNDM